MAHLRCSNWFLSTWGRVRGLNLVLGEGLLPSLKQTLRPQKPAINGVTPISRVISYNPSKTPFIFGHL